MKRFALYAALTILSLLAFALAARAQVITAVNQSIPTTSYFWSSNLLGGTGATLKVDTKHTGGPTGNGGQQTTNQVPANTTNTALFTAPIDLTWYDAEGIQIEITGSAASNTWATNRIFLYPCPDGVNPDTNNFWTLGPFTNNVLFTNVLVTSNLTMNNGPMSSGCARYWQVGWGVQGTNTMTNTCVQLYAGRHIIRTEQP